MEKSKSNRILVTATTYAKQNFCYVQEVGTLESIEPHICSRNNLNSFLFLIVLAGNGDFTYQSKKYHLETGHCVLIDCKQAYSHESNSETPWKLMWVHFNGNFPDKFYQYYHNQGNQFIFQPQNKVDFIDCISN